MAGCQPKRNGCAQSTRPDTANASKKMDYLRWSPTGNVQVPCGKLWKEAALHLVAAEVVVGKPFEPLAKLFPCRLFADCPEAFRTLQHRFINKNRAVDAQSQSQRIAGPGVDG